MEFDLLQQNLLKGNHQNKYYTGGQEKYFKILYPAIVVPNQIDDPSGQDRLRARIVSIDDETGQIRGKQNSADSDYNLYSGKDRGISDEKLPLCIPFLPKFLRIKPQVGELVWLILENPQDNSSTRFWVGPIVTSDVEMSYQSYEEAIKIFDYTNFFSNKNLLNKIKTYESLPKGNDISLRGRNDSDLILRFRESLLVSGKFNKDSIDPNTRNPSFLQLKQVTTDTSLRTSNDNFFDEFSQATLGSTNINLYSTRGKFRSNDIKSFEKNNDIKFFGDLADTLHPTVFGDELIKLLDLIVKILLNHIHTSQKPLIETPESKELKKYTVDGNLQDLISNILRIN